MIDLIQAQRDLYNLLQSSVQLQTVNVVLQREKNLQFEAAVATALDNPRNGCSGAGIVVKKLRATFSEPSVSGPILDWVFPVLILIIPSMNFAQATADRPARGTMLEAEQIMQMVLDEVHHYDDERLSTFVPASNAVIAASVLDGTGVGYADGFELSFALSKPRSPQTARTGQVQKVVAGSVATLACALDPMAQIRYTLDGGFPGSDLSDHKGIIYGGPITVPAGRLLRARAYAAGKLGSACVGQQF